MSKDIKIYNCVLEFALGILKQEILNGLNMDKCGGEVVKIITKNG